eukprot:m.35201 g.35201  ORF g.35201 m.35201 type:complete len:164 (+) comp7420_c0_seq1:836-1327(+)
MERMCVTTTATTSCARKTPTTSMHGPKLIRGSLPSRRGIGKAARAATGRGGRHRTLAAWTRLALSTNHSHVQRGRRLANPSLACSLFFFLLLSQYLISIFASPYFGRTQFISSTDVIERVVLCSESRCVDQGQPAQGGGVKDIALERRTSGGGTITSELTLSP